MKSNRGCIIIPVNYLECNHSDKKQPGITEKTNKQPTHPQKCRPRSWIEEPEIKATMEY